MNLQESNTVTNKFSQISKYSCIKFQRMTLMYNAMTSLQATTQGDHRRVGAGQVASGQCASSAVAGAGDAASSHPLLPHHPRLRLPCHCRRTNCRAKLHD